VSIFDEDPPSFCRGCDEWSRSFERLAARERARVAAAEARAEKAEAAIDEERRLRRLGIEPPPCRECASMVVGGRCLSCGAEYEEDPDADR
jgi:hypothetical protein